MISSERSPRIFREMGRPDLVPYLLPENQTRLLKILEMLAQHALSGYPFSRSFYLDQLLSQPKYAPWAKKLEGLPFPKLRLRFLPSVPGLSTDSRPTPLGKALRELKEIHPGVHFCVTFGVSREITGETPGEKARIRMVEEIPRLHRKNAPPSPESYDPKTGQQPVHDIDITIIFNRPNSTTLKQFWRQTEAIWAKYGFESEFIPASNSWRGFPRINIYYWSADGKKVSYCQIAPAEFRGKYSERFGILEDGLAKQSRQVLAVPLTKNGSWAGLFFEPLPEYCLGEKRVYFCQAGTYTEQEARRSLKVKICCPDDFLVAEGGPQAAYRAFGLWLESMRSDFLILFVRPNHRRDDLKAIQRAVTNNDSEKIHLFALATAERMAEFFDRIAKYPEDFINNPSETVKLTESVLGALKGLDSDPYRGFLSLLNKGKNPTLLTDRPTFEYGKGIAASIFPLLRKFIYSDSRLQELLAIMETCPYGPEEGEGLERFIGYLYDNQGLEDTVLALIPIWCYSQPRENAVLVKRFVEEILKAREQRQFKKDALNQAMDIIRIPEKTYLPAGNKE